VKQFEIKTLNANVIGERKYDNRHQSAHTSVCLAAI